MTSLRYGLFSHLTCAILILITLGVVMFMLLLAMTFTIPASAQFPLPTPAPTMTGQPPPLRRPYYAPLVWGDVTGCWGYDCPRPTSYP